MRVLIAVPPLMLLVLFALSNTAPVPIGLWPTDLAIEMPLSLAMLVGMGVAYVVGGLIVWVTALAQRRRARRAEARVRMLVAEVAALKARLALASATTAPLPPSA